MAEKSDLEKLAVRYLDLWQEQLAMTAADPALVDAIAEMLHTSAASAALLDPQRLFATSLAMQGMGGAERADDSTAADRDRASATGSAAAAPSPGDSRRDMDRLAERLAAVEERLAALEVALGAGGRGAAPRARRRRT